MIKKINLVVVLLMMFLHVNAQKQPSAFPSNKGKLIKLPYTKMALTAKLLGVAIGDTAWYNWCISPIEGKDKKIHIFGARWPAKTTMNGWLSPQAEVAHYVADKPEGPFKYVSTVLKTSMFADTTKMFAPCNPRISYIDGKYVLVYIYQTEKNKVQQEIGMMVADNLNGPWRFAGNQNGTIGKSSPDSTHWTYKSVIGIDNPTMIKIGAKYCIYFKSGTPQQMKAKYGYLVSDKLEGPYQLSPKPATDNIDYIEDAVAFNVQNNYYLITTDNNGTNTGVFGDLILWKSKSGTDFKLADAKIAMGTMFDYWGTPEQQKKLLKVPGHFEYSASSKLERPAVLMQNGKPTYLYAPAGVNISGGKTAENYVFKINWNNGE